MKIAEATQLLASELAESRQRSYEELAARVDSPKRTVEVVGPSGTRYYVDVMVCWDDGPDRNVRVIGAIDDGRARAFVPLTDAFMKAPDGSFVGEDGRSSP